MKVLSLFDGISCGRVALEQADIEVDRYVAYEIDRYAIEISKKNWPHIEHRGDVIGADFKEFEGFDLLIGGSPCQGFSFAGKMLNFEDARSKLFWEFKRALEEVKPKYFLLENVHMKKEWLDIISENVGVEPVNINSKFFTAQNRNRWYWTNIEIGEYEDRGICLNDVIGYECNPAAQRGRYFEGKVKQQLEVRDTDNKCNSLTTVAKDSLITTLPAGRYLEWNKEQVRKLTANEREILQGLPLDYTKGVSESQRCKQLGNGWTVPVIEHIFGGLK